MPLTRRAFLGTAAALGLAASCSAPAPAPARPLDGADALIDWIAAHRDLTSVLLDDGRGGTVELNTDRARPIASAGKVVHLTAYARAVAAGRLDPDAAVTVTDWERWYVPATDGLVHPKALRELGVGPGGSARWDDLVRVMIDFSDNAVPDLIRDTLGDAALVAAAGAGAWTAPDLPSFAGSALLSPGYAGPGGVPAGTDRRSAELAAARSYAADPAQRAAAAQRGAAIEAAASNPAPDAAARDAAAEPVYRWFDGAAAATVTQLAGLHRAAATGRLGAEVSTIVRGHLERTLAAKLPDGVLGAGQKGGNLPGLVSNAFTVRRADGTLGISVLSLSGMPRQAYEEATASGAVLLLSQRALLDGAVRDRLRRAVTGP